MPKCLLNIILFSSLLLVSSIHCTVIAQEEAVQIRGVYGNPNALWRQGYTLPELGVNSIFVHSGSLNKALMQRAQSENIMVFAEFATLNGKNYVEKHPEAWPILKNGEKAPAALRKAYSVKSARSTETPCAVAKAFLSRRSPNRSIISR